jgi:lipopolysaccharide biosynthesis regulator YciM
LVLNRQTDEALELFVQMAKVDDDTLETHFALGHLFRRRGEVDRAIRVHQNLLARPNLAASQRDHALYSLAEDYLSAGLFDRAEKLFSELINSESHAESALRKLVYIYEQEREWQQAIEAHRRLEVLLGEKSSQVAHYYCELAEQARIDGNLDEARAFLKHTVRSESGALRGDRSLPTGYRSRSSLHLRSIAERLSRLRVRSNEGRVRDVRLGSHRAGSRLG